MFVFVKCLRESIQAARQAARTTVVCHLEREDILVQTIR